MLIGGAVGIVAGVLLADLLGYTGIKKTLFIAGCAAAGAIIGNFLAPYMTKLLALAKAKIAASATLTAVSKTVIDYAKKALGSVTKFVVSSKHLLGAGGNYAKFNTNSHSTIRGWISEALRYGSNFKVNSSDSYYIVYNMGKVIGTKGEKFIRVVFTMAGKIITAYPQKLVIRYD
jgi:hypothetical protein